MIIILLLILPTLRSTEPNRIAHEGNTALAIKQGISNYTNAIPPGISDFTELTRKSKLFIDNTLICKEILNEPSKVTTIFSPGRWGKSTVLTMLKSFLEIQVDQQGNKISPRTSTNNYKLFKQGKIVHEDGKIEKLQTPLLIADEAKIMKHHQGQYVVVYISFKDAIGQTYAEIQANLSLAVHRAYKQHDYMIAVLERELETRQNISLSYKRSMKHHLKIFKNILQTPKSLNLTSFDFVHSLEDLGNCLSHHFDKEVYLLIGDYDTPLHSFLKSDKFSENDETKIYSSLEGLILKSIKSRVFCRTVLTGTFSFKFNKSSALRMKHIIDNRLHTEDRRDRLEFTKLREYFGFKDGHIQFLFEKHNITGPLAQQATQWYNGYRTNVLKYDFYNPASIVQFLFHKNIACYRPLNTYSNFIQKLFNEEPRTRRRVLSILSKEHTHDYISSTHYGSLWYKMRSNHHFQNANRPLRLEHIFEVILWSEDYLVGDFETSYNALANNEVAFLMSTWLIAHYTWKYHIADHLLDNASNSLLDLIKSEQTIQPLKESLERLYKQSILNATKSEHEDSAHAILNCVALRMQCVSKFQLDIYYDKIKRADLAIYDHTTQRGIVVHLRENQASAHSAFDFATECAKSLKLPNAIQKIQKIAINIFANKSIDILTATVPFEHFA